MISVLDGKLEPLYRNFFSIAYINCSAEPADRVCSTEQMLTYCRTNPARQFVVVTESGIIHGLKKELSPKNQTR